MEVEVEEPTVEGGAAALPGSAEEEVANFPVPFSPGSMALTYEQNLKQTEAEVDLMFPKSLNFYISTPNCSNFDSCAVCEAYALCPYGCGSVLSQAPPPPPPHPLLHTPLSRPVVTHLCRECLPQVCPTKGPCRKDVCRTPADSVTNRCRGMAAQDCYKPSVFDSHPYVEAADRRQVDQTHSDCCW